MILECTDCDHCADFCSGYRVFCLHPSLPSNEVVEYHPVGSKDATDCYGFNCSEGGAKYFSWGSLKKADAFSKKQYGEILYEGIRDWCLAHGIIRALQATKHVSDTTMTDMLRGLLAPIEKRSDRVHILLSVLSLIVEKLKEDRTK